MILWKWKAVGESGRLERGLAKGTDLNKVLAWLRARDLYPVKIRPSVFYTFRVRVASWQALLFWARTTRKIGTFLEAGIPLITVLNILALKEPDPFKKAEWQDVIQKIENGEDLSSALKEFIPAPGIFVEAMIQTGERCGTLSNCLLEAAEQLEEEHFFLRRLKSLLFYPCLLFIVTLVILYVLSLVILPMYKDLFLEFGADLPLLTKILFQLGRGIPYFLASGALFILLNLILSRKRLIFKIPGLKEI
jgi:type IV pilus assembly protein PilC